VAEITVAEPTSAAGTGTTTLTVTLSPPSGQPVTVQYATANGSATGDASCASGVDYVSASGTLTFSPGDVSKTVPVTICGDSIAETSEAFTLTLSGPTGGGVLGSHPTATVTITDATGTASLNVADLTTAEPASASGTAPATVTVALSLPSGQPVTVQYATANGTATGGSSCASGVDYQTASGTLTFSPGDTTSTVAVAICGDAVDEPDETFTLALSSPTGGAVLGTHATATVTIRATDTTPCQTVLSAAVPVGSNALPVVSQAGCNLGDHVSLNPGGANEERFIITGFGSILIDQATTKPHAAGEALVRIAATDDLGRSRALPEDRPDTPRKMTEEQRQQRQRTDRSGRDDVAAEGNVTAIACDAAIPSITIANRDGLVEVQLLHDAALSCSSAQVGDYLEAAGEKQTEQSFEADTITLHRGGQPLR
jgi:hypothetical protein